MPRRWIETLLLNTSAKPRTSAVPDLLAGLRAAEQSVPAPRDRRAS
jgi:hypothetical protein